ncbi:MAG: NUDIX hydrolase [Actinomycetaceae bacterium]|nr:NUDIX hydrolase [Actinomycetaceae bacterium]
MIADQPMSAEVHTHRRVWEGAVFDMDEDVISVPGEEAKLTRHYVAHPGAVAVVALRESSSPSGLEVALIDQYRHPVQAKLWEIPAGLLDIEGEDPLQAAKRELWEEANLEAASWQVLVDYFTSPGGSTEGLRIYLAREVAEVAEEAAFDRRGEEATMTLRWVDLDEAVAAIHAGKLHNPSAVVGVLATASARAQQWEPLRPADAAWMRSPWNRAER